MKTSRLFLALGAVALSAVPPAFAQTAFQPGQAPSEADDQLPPPPPPPSADDEDVAAPSDALPPAVTPTQQTFEQRLSPYGRWVDTPEYGRVFIPSDESARTDWQPYTDGRWVDTEWGWSFAADVPWGWAAFHYGRWGFGDDLGWYWVPGYSWAPAWVAWRWRDGYACWSPFAPYGFRFGARWPGWVAMPREHFTRPITRFAVGRTQIGPIVRGAAPIRGFATARALPAGPRWSATVRAGAVRGGGNTGYARSWGSSGRQNWRGAGGHASGSHAWGAGSRGPGAGWRGSGTSGSGSRGGAGAHAVGGGGHSSNSGGAHSSGGGGHSSGGGAHSGGHGGGGHH